MKIESTFLWNTQAWPVVASVCWGGKHWRESTGRSPPLHLKSRNEARKSAKQHESTSRQAMHWSTWKSALVVMGTTVLLLSQISELHTDPMQETGQHHDAQRIGWPASWRRSTGGPPPPLAQSLAAPRTAHVPELSQQEPGYARTAHLPIGLRVGAGPQVGHRLAIVQQPQRAVLQPVHT